VSRILVIEDDPAILRGLADNLKFESHEVLTAADGETGYRLIGEQQPDLIILDLMLPKLSGYEVCRKVRDEGITTPIMMLTARGEEGDRVLGLDLGADDYVTKPFSVRELLARVRALLRRAQPPGLLPDELRFDDVVIDFRRYEAHKGDKPLEMTRKEFGVLRLLASRPGEVVTRDELLNEVWGFENYPTTRTVDNHIATLRAKLENNPSEPRHLLTVHGVGYKLLEFSKFLTLCAILAFMGLTSISTMAKPKWQVLFNGKSTDAWRGFRQDGFPSKCWTIENGSLRTIAGCDRTERVDLISKDEYQNFELEVEWRVAPGASSGIIYLVSEDANATWMTGPEMQVLDEEKHRDGKNSNTSAGALYGLIAPTNKTLRPVGEYNKVRINCQERTFRVSA
jgi:DNA-binding response OmpR family regulator